MTREDEHEFRKFQAARVMAEALGSVDLDDLIAIREALRIAGHDDQLIDNVMHDAISIAQDRRSLRRWVGSACEAFCLAAFLGTGYLIFAPDRAFAAEVQPMPAGREWLTFALIAIAALVIWLGVSRPEPKAEDDERPHGDTTGYDRNPKWRQ